MTTEPKERIDRIRAALEGAGLKWLFNAPDADERAAAFSAEVDAAEALYNSLYAPTLPLLEKVENDSSRYRPFLQSIGLPVSTELRVIILRLIEGNTIRELEFRYVENGSSELVVLLSDEWPEDRRITASSPWDALLLPQLGYAVSDEKLLLGGIRPWTDTEEE